MKLNSMEPGLRLKQFLLQTGIEPRTTRSHVQHLMQMSYQGWLVVLGLTALRDSISVYIGPSPREREKETRKDR